jgi:hypothetical protein
VICPDRVVPIPMGDGSSASEIARGTLVPGTGAMMHAAAIGTLAALRGRTQLGYFGAVSRGHGGRTMCRAATSRFRRGPISVRASR